MKLSKLFHTLYATVMALPVIIIPIFAININQKNVEPISIEVQEKISVDFNQYVRPNFDSGNITTENYTFTNNNGTLNVNGTFTSRVVYYVNQNAGHTQYFENVINHKFYLKGMPASYTYGVSGGLFIGTWYTSNVSNIFIATANNFYANIWIAFQDITLENANYTLQLFDLTQMYGEGNEPTIQEFNNTFTLNYYDYTESQKMLVNKPSLTSYNDTDIGSQFLYSLYKPVNDYFNFGKFFGLSGMYDWFQLNIFNGTAPLSFFIVFNVMIYWLFISLFWLLFDILIYVPMVIHKWLDKAEM